MENEKKNTWKLIWNTTNARYPYKLLDTDMQNIFSKFDIKRALKYATC